MKTLFCLKPSLRFLIQLAILSITIFAASLSRCLAQTDVTTQHNNLKRTGWNNTETVLTQNNVRGGSFGKLFTRAVDGQIYTQPLILTNVSIGGGIRNIVIVTTVNNSVYAFDADNASLATPYWYKSVTFDSANYRPVENTDMTGACGGSYRDISGKMGIIGTPVIDPTTNTLYLVSRSVSKTGATFVQYLHALDLSTGSEKPNSPVYITASVLGTSSGSSGGFVTFNQQKQNQRPALLLYNGAVFISWASHCDWGPYHGWLIGYDATTLQQKYVYNATPNGIYGGIWMSGQAPAVDDSGFIYITTGNGTTGITGNPNDTTERGESLIKLSTVSGNLKVADFFTPFDYDNLNTLDLDFGSDGAMLIPNTNLSLSGSKESYLYLIDNNNMQGTTTDNSNVKQLLNINASSTETDKHLHGSPVYFKDQNANEYIYAWAESGLLKQFPFDRTTMLFDTLNKILGNTVLPVGMPGAILSLSSNGSQNNTAILWASHPIDGDANRDIVPGVLQAFDANDISHELWNSNWSSLRDSAGRLAKFVAPTIANGKVYLSTFSNTLNVYGLNPPAVSACSGTLPSPWQSADIGYTAFPGDVCYSNGKFTITASGVDINGTADAFHNVFQPVLSNSITITARIDSMQNTNTSAKCGIMFRANLDPGSPQVFMALTPKNGGLFESRLLQSGATNLHTIAGPVIPSWVRIISNGNKYVGYYSADGINWTALDSVIVALGSNPYVGLSYTPHNNTITGKAVVDNVTISTLGVLPLEILSFKGYNIHNKVSRLNWSSTNEINVDHFDVESSTNTTDYKLIGSVKGVNTSVAKNDYSFDDLNPFNGNNFYRLKEVGKDGNFKYSLIAKVTFNFKVLDIFPNPAHAKIYIRNNNYFTGNDKLNIELLNVEGETVYKQILSTAGIGIITINIPSRITTGMYVLKIANSKGEKQAKKIYIEN